MRIHQVVRCFFAGLFALALCAVPVGAALLLGLPRGDAEKHNVEFQQYD